MLAMDRASGVTLRMVWGSREGSREPMEFLITSVHNTAMFLLATGPLAVLVTAAAIQIATGGHRDE